MPKPGDFGPEYEEVRMALAELRRGMRDCRYISLARASVDGLRVEFLRREDSRRRARLQMLSAGNSWTTITAGSDSDGLLITAWFAEVDDERVRVRLRDAIRAIPDVHWPPPTLSAAEGGEFITLCDGTNGGEVIVAPYVLHDDVFFQPGMRAIAEILRSFARPLAPGDVRRLCLNEDGPWSAHERLEEAEALAALGLARAKLAECADIYGGTVLMRRFPDAAVIYRAYDEHVADPVAALRLV